jgi:hypothetical protein
MSNDPDGETRARTDGELAEALQERDAARVQRDREHAQNDELAAHLELAAAEVLRLRAALSPTPANCRTVLVAWKGDDKGSGEERAVRVLEALAAAAGMGEKGA